MKTRENELHEPIIKMWIANKGYYVTANCPICDTIFGGAFSEDNKDDAISRAKRFHINYCPNCGARLKEIEE